MRPNVAERRITAFTKRFGTPYLYLAYHAAFPLALTPDLLYRLWANFQRDIDARPLNIPWIAVADLLLSGLCEEVGRELYEMDDTIRQKLLDRLRNDERFGQARIVQLSDFLLGYVRQQLQSNDPDTQDFARAQQWTALAYTKPSEAARQLALTFRQSGLDTTTPDKSELVRMASLVETLAEPLTEANLEPLLIYARSMANFARGKPEAATNQLQQITEAGKIQIAGVDLPIPEPLQEESKAATGADYSHQNLRGRSFKGQDLTGANFSDTDLRSADFTNAILVGANFTRARTGLRRRWATGLVLCAIVLLVLASLGAWLIGFLLGAALSLWERETPMLGSILIPAGAVGAIAFLVFWLTNLRQGLEAVSKALTRALLSGVASLFVYTAIAALLGGFPAGFSSSIENTIIVLAGSVGLLLFLVTYFLTLRRGIVAAWGATALALVGASYWAGGVGFAIGQVLRQWSVPPFLAWTIAILAVGIVLVRVATRIGTRNRIKALAASGAFGLALGGAVAVSNVLGENNVSAAIAGAGLAVAIALTMGMSGTQTRALTRTFIVAVVGVVLVAPIAAVVSFMAEAPISVMAWLLPLTMAIVFLVAIPLTLAGTAALSGTIAGIDTVAVAIAVYFTLVWINPSGDTWAVTIATIAATVVAVALAWATIVTMAIAVAVVGMEAGNFLLALVWSVGVTGAVIATVSVVAVASELGTIEVAGSLGIGIAVVVMGAYLGWRALVGDRRFAWIRQFAVTLAATGGTSFRGADLTDANFTRAILKSADLRKANITRTCWLQAQRLDRACTDKSYLQHPQIQQLVTTGIGRHVNGDRLDLRGINLHNADLTEASFLDGNLGQADLQGANLTGAKLVRTQLDGANLTGAHLTGAYIQAVHITDTTQFHGVECNYFYQQVPTPEQPNRDRIPSHPRKMLKPGELVNYLRIRE